MRPLAGQGTWLVYLVLNPLPEQIVCTVFGSMSRIDQCLSRSVSTGP
jgi:hypothetical protein